MEQILNSYYENEAKKLHKLVDKIVNRKFGGTANKDMDSYYSSANEVMFDMVKNNRYNSSKGDFEGFLYSALVKAFIDDYKHDTRDKRTTKIEVEVDGKRKKIPIPDVYLDAPIREDENTTLGDMIKSDFDIDSELAKEDKEYQDERVEKYLSSLSKVQRQIIEMQMEDVSISIIKQKLGLSDKEYERQFNQIKSFDNIKAVRTLFSNSCKCAGKEEEQIMTSQITHTAEKSKPVQYSIASINKKIENRTIRFDHPLQRESDQWCPSMKGNLISDILQGNPLPEIVFAEQIINNIPVVWDLDGKQRCTTCYAFANDGFKISRNIRRWNIEYVSQIKDGDGKPVLDDGGYPTSEYKKFDIRNKKFSQLPTELQEKFLDYTFKCDQYLNCDSEDIAYHIIRYNEGKNMNKAQRGITRIGEDFAALVKSISAMPFFREKGGYKVSELKNGTLERVVVESVMASKYLDEWKKEQEYICEYLKDNAKSEDFDDFEEMVIRLENIITDETSDMFNSKDSFLWFGLFARFNKTGEDDEKFIEFMAEFARSLHSKMVDGVTYDELCIDKKTGRQKSTKDKYIVISKIQLLEKLMLDYLGICKGDVDSETMDCVSFVKDNVSSDITEEDVELFEMVANDKSGAIDNLDSWMLSDENRISFMALVGYAIRGDNDDLLDEWLPIYEKNNSFILNQKDNFIHMKEDFDKFIVLSKKEKLSA